MSLEDRDWMRGEPRAGLSLAAVSPKWILIGGTVLAFIAQNAVENAGPRGEAFVHDHLALSHRGLRAGEAWQAVTYALLHAGPGHLFWNMAALWLFGTVAEDRLSRGRIFLLYLLGTLGGAAGCLLWSLADLRGGELPVVGASGAVMGVLAFAVVRAPRTPFLLFFVFPVPLVVLGGLFVGVDLLKAFSDDPGGVAVQAHFGGAAAGALFAWAPWARRRAGSAARKAPGRSEAFRDPDPPRLAPQPPAAKTGDDDEVRMDALLDRIHASGITSLTEEEKAFLTRVSSRYRQRKR